MCLIVDVNVAPNVLLSDNDPDYKEVHKRLFANRGPAARLIYGGMLLEEYQRNADVWRILLALDRAGRAYKMSEQEVDTESTRLQSLNECQSNDHHIIALARIGKVRLLCSRDKALAADFTNKKLLDNPRGKVYQSHQHRHLLSRFCK